MRKNVTLAKLGKPVYYPSVTVRVSHRVPMDMTQTIGYVVSLADARQRSSPRVPLFTLC